MVYNCSNNSIILSGLRARLSASFTLKSFTPFLLHPHPPSLFLASSFLRRRRRRRCLSRVPSSFLLAVSSSSLCGFFLLLPRFDPLRALHRPRHPPLVQSIINLSIPSRSFHPHIIRARHTRREFEPRLYPPPPRPCTARTRIVVSRLAHRPRRFIFIYLSAAIYMHDCK